MYEFCVCCLKNIDSLKFCRIISLLIEKHGEILPCDDILGNVEDLIAGFVGFVSASRGRHCRIVWEGVRDYCVSIRYRDGIDILS